ncbi:MAG TPA: outer membrane beta-barrel protein [Vicinamibacteria bacterium]|nr:outer membrane beta-barrel protein [Vicinamibacteria bacterium]
MRNTTIVTTIILLSLGSNARSQERGIELSGLLTTTFQHELDTTDLGFGGRIGYRATPLLGIEGELSFYPGDVPERVTFTRSRLEGLFGITVGPRFNRFSVFGKARPGFVRFAGAHEPIPCILIFPPPLSCVLAEGRTVFALDLGGGIELYPTERSLVRVDLSNLLLRYPAPAINRDREAVTEDSFWGGNLKLTFSMGLRF